MADMSVALENAAVKAAIVPGTTYYIGLNSATPGQTGANEASGGAYARKAVVFGTPVTGKEAATAAVTLTTPTTAGAWPYVTLWTAAAGGTFVWGGSSGLGTGSIPAGSTVHFAAATITAKVS